MGNYKINKRTSLCFIAIALIILYYTFDKSKKSSLRHKFPEEWIESLKNITFKRFSQQEEDGVLKEVFEKIGTTNKIYVEFGVQDCTECNTRNLRANLGWDVKNSLLMDGGYSNPDINLQKEFFWPSNIVHLFEKYKVRKDIDLLSVDTDSYDWFTLEAILLADYRPRVIIAEININLNQTDSKSIMPPEKGTLGKLWDGTKYHGMSIQAFVYLMKRYQYSAIWCNHVNCLAVRNDVLGRKIHRSVAQLDHHHWPNSHRCDKLHRPFAIIGIDGKFTGETDGGLGSPAIRC